MNSGIYKITNLINDKIYIGSTININKREIGHFNRLVKGNHENHHLQNSFNKYNKENFKFEVLELCGINELLNKEQEYLNNLKPEYNICKIAGNCLGRKFSNETRNKMSLSQKKNYLLGNTNGILGRKGSQNPKAKINEDIVKNIKLDILNNTESKIIINKYNITSTIFYKIKQNRSWKHVII